MLAVVQRVTGASVHVPPDYTASIGPGMLILLGVAQEDDDSDVRWLAEKCASLRMFADEVGKMNVTLTDIRGSALVVSQFTLLGDCEKGRRPSFTRAAHPDKADCLYRGFVAELRGRDVHVETGIFAAMMQVSLVNDGPVTLLVDSGPWKMRRQERVGRTEEGTE
jgi:D-tyrosyl-tRNA(Tyr) deacylase